jgi:hypothetical protein
MTCYQRRDFGDGRCSAVSSGTRFTNDATVAEMCQLNTIHETFYQRSECRQSGSVGTHPAHVLPTAQMWWNLFEWLTAPSTFYQRHDGGGVRLSDAANRLQCPILDITFYQRRGLSDGRCSGFSSERRFTNDSNAVE